MVQLPVILAGGSITQAVARLSSLATNSFQRAPEPRARFGGGDSRANPPWGSLS